MHVGTKLPITRRQLFAGGIVSGLFLLCATVVARMIPRERVPGLSVLSSREAKIYLAMAQAAYPGTDHAPAVDPEYALRYFDEYLARVGMPYNLTLLAGLYGIEFGSIIFGRIGTMSSLNMDDRITLLERWRTGPMFARSIMSGMKTIVAMAYWSQVPPLTAISAYQKCPNWDGALLE